MKLYAGFDLHSRSSHLAVLDQNGKKVFKAKLANDMQIMTLALEPYRERLAAIAVESTFNWYLACGCSDGGRLSSASSQPGCHSEIQGTQAFR